MSSDVTLFDHAFLFQCIHFLWKGTLELFIFGCMIYREMRFCGLFGLGLIVSLVPLQSILQVFFFLRKKSKVCLQVLLVWMGHMSAKYRLQTSQCIEERFKVMHEIIRGIQMIKMHTWERSFVDVVDSIRRWISHLLLLNQKEHCKCCQPPRQPASIQFQMRVNRHTIRQLNFNISRFAIFYSLIGFVCFGNVFTERQVFTIYYNFLFDSVIISWSSAIQTCAETIVGLKRIEPFLLLSEKSTTFGKF